MSMGYRKFEVFESYQIAKYHRKIQVETLQNLYKSNLFGAISLADIKIEYEKFLVEISTHLDKVLF